MIDWTKPIQTRDGQKARYLGTVNDRSSIPHIVAYEVTAESGRESYLWCSDSGVGRDGAALVINTPVVEERWLNVYKAGSSLAPTPCITAEHADLVAGGSAQGKVKIIYHDGVAVGCEFVKAA